jgi:hypothetical protein
MKRLRPFTVRKCSSLFGNSSPLFLAIGSAHGWTGLCARTIHTLAVGILPAMFILRSSREEIYNVLWVLVFGFATLNILSLGARRFENEKRGLSFGEILAIMVVLLSVVLLAWELLYFFHVLPIRINPE